MNETAPVPDQSDRRPGNRSAVSADRRSCGTGTSGAFGCPAGGTGETVRVAEPRCLQLYRTPWRQRRTHQNTCSTSPAQQSVPGCRGRPRRILLAATAPSHPGIRGWLVLLRDHPFRHMRTFTCGRSAIQRANCSGAAFRTRAQQSLQCVFERNGHVPPKAGRPHLGSCHANPLQMTVRYR